jgi:class 3 adenylate cyclase
MINSTTQRRLAAILAADVVGYSRLMGQDEAGTLGALKAVRTDVIDPKVAEHGGRIFNTTGDGFLAEFPSVVSAVSCAVEIQRGMQQRNENAPQDKTIQLRIGINLGDIIVEGEDMFGDGVNVAARIESITPPRWPFRGRYVITSVLASTFTLRIREKKSSKILNGQSAFTSCIGEKFPAPHIRNSPTSHLLPFCRFRI